MQQGDETMLSLSAFRWLRGIARVMQIGVVGCVIGWCTLARGQSPPHRTVLLSGQEAPGTGGLTFDSALFPQIDTQARVAFYGTLRTGGGVHSENNHAIWGPAAGQDLALIARS